MATRNLLYGKWRHIRNFFTQNTAITIDNIAFLQIAMFETYDTMTELIQISAGVLSTLKVNASRCEGALTADMLATDLAYYLVRKSVPFREAHSLSGELVC